MFSVSKSNSSNLYKKLKSFKSIFLILKSYTNNCDGLNNGVFEHTSAQH